MFYCPNCGTEMEYQGVVQHRQGLDTVDYVCADCDTRASVPTTQLGPKRARRFPSGSVAPLLRPGAGSVDAEGRITKEGAR